MYQDMKTTTNTVGWNGMTTDQRLALVAALEGVAATTTLPRMQRALRRRVAWMRRALAR